MNFISLTWLGCRPLCFISHILLIEKAKWHWQSYKAQSSNHGLYLIFRSGRQWCLYLSRLQCRQRWHWTKPRQDPGVSYRPNFIPGWWCMTFFLTLIHYWAGPEWWKCGENCRSLLSVLLDDIAYVCDIVICFLLLVFLHCMVNYLSVVFCAQCIELTNKGEKVLFKFNYYY